MDKRNKSKNNEEKQFDDPMRKYQDISDFADHCHTPSFGSNMDSHLLSEGSYSDFDDDLDDLEFAPGKDDMSMMSSDQEYPGNQANNTERLPTSTGAYDMGVSKSRSSSFDSIPHNKRKASNMSDNAAKSLAKEKNREHAKNTRMRKKNFIESLKDTVKQLADDREKTERERTLAITKLLEQVCVLFNVFGCF